MLWVDGWAVVFALAATAEEVPAALLLLEIQAGGIWEEEPSENHARQAEPGDDVEFGLGVDVIVEDGSEESTEFTDCGGKAVGCRADRGGEDFCGDEEGYRVGAELIEKAAEEIHGLEGVDVFWGGVVFEIEGGDDEEDEIHEESNLLHPFPAVEFVVDEKG